MTFVIVVANASSGNKNVRLNFKRNNRRRVWISHAVSKYQKQKLNSSACLLRYGCIWEDC